MAISTRENNINIFKLPCNVLFIIWSEVGTCLQRTCYIFFHVFTKHYSTVLIVFQHHYLLILGDLHNARAILVSQRNVFLAPDIT